MKFIEDLVHYTELSHLYRTIGL
eukprot:SAG31_NODE_11677_length_1007_cov_1.362335_2_plen_22_part_01